MKYILYNHVGSANHGCEALVRTISKILGEMDTILLSEAPEEEKVYGITQLIEVHSAFAQKHNLFDFLKAYLSLKIKGDYFPLDVLPYKNVIKHVGNENDTLVSIGGDIYCYDNYPKYILLHQYARKFIKKSILLGCSIEGDLLKDTDLVRDLQSYDLISVRESITYAALLDAGLKNVMYCPDTAFALKAESTCLPDEFIPGETVGFNISPLVLAKSKNAELLMENYCRAVEYLLRNTTYAVAFIPHVSWKSNDDSIPLNELYQKYKNTGRVCILPDLSAPKIKYCISKCKYFVGARTHATIAAYSSGIPTLVLGYSVKSRGIAKDLFGTDENYVVDYKKIEDDTAILNGLSWIMEHDEEIKHTLNCKQYEYVSQIHRLKQDIEDKIL